MTKKAPTNVVGAFLWSAPGERTFSGAKRPRSPGSGNTSGSDTTASLTENFYSKALNNKGLTNNAYLIY